MAHIATIYVLDDDARICRVLERLLTAEGFTVETMQTAVALYSRLENRVPDLVLLDLVLPDGDGFAVLREIRTMTDIPVILLTGKSDTVDKVVGLELGADDYVTKPFQERELLARIRTILRRSGAGQSAFSADEGRRRATFAGWELDLTAQELTSPDQERIYLTSYEYRLLEALIQRPNRVLSRDRILELVADRDWNPFDRSIDVLVGKLRKKIELDPKDPRLIKTIRGVGYKFTATVEKR